MTTNWTPEGKMEHFGTLWQAWSKCTLCRLSQTRTNIVFGNGDPNADIMLIGEAPGETEDETGDAFVGRCGGLLSDLCAASGLRREDLFITNLVKCWPPGNRIPQADERKVCLELLNEQIYTVDPVVILPVGAEAMTSLMGGGWKGITKNHGKVGHIEVPARSATGLRFPPLKTIRYPAIPIMHPSYILREDKISKKTGNWEVGGPAHKTMGDLINIRRIVEQLRKMREPIRARMEAGQFEWL